jgi:hypothetical protein
MRPIFAALKVVLQQYETEVRPAVARLAPDGYGLGDYVFDVLVRIRVQLRERSKRRLNGLG